eukprot:143352-Chlamydomonas_euryale.AAC.3
MDDMHDATSWTWKQESAVDPVLSLVNGALCYNYDFVEEDMKGIAPGKATIRGTACVPSHAAHPSAGRGGMADAAG